MPLTHEETKELAENVLDMDPRDHWADHQYIQGLRASEARWVQMREKVLASGLISAIFVAAAFLANALWHEFTAKLATILK